MLCRSCYAFWTKEDHLFNIREGTDCPKNEDKCKEPHGHAVRFLCSEAITLHHTVNILARHFERRASIALVAGGEAS